jgi:hypothetical protein
MVNALQNEQIIAPEPNERKEMMEPQPQGKLPLNITFVIMQLRAPNQHWYDVIPILSWRDEFSQRMDTMMCLADEIDQIKEGVCFLIGERFDIQEVKEEKMLQTYTRGQIVKIGTSEGQCTKRIWNDVGIGIEVCREEEYQRVLQERDFLGVNASFFPKEHVLEVLPSA